MSVPAPETAPRFAGIALDTGLLVTLATALLFVAGWGYAEQWLGSFDLGVIGLGIPSGYFAMYGYWVVTANLWWLVPGAVLAALLPFLRCWPWARRRLQARSWPRLSAETRTAARGAARVLLPGLILFSFWGAYALGRQTADHSFARHEGNGFCAFPSVRVVPNAKSLPGLPEALAAGQYRLLIQSGGVLALFRADRPDAPVKPRHPSLVVPVAEIAAMELTPVPPGCGPR